MASSGRPVERQAYRKRSPDNREIQNELEELDYLESFDDRHYWITLPGLAELKRDHPDEVQPFLDKCENLRATLRELYEADVEEPNVPVLKKETGLVDTDIVLCLACLLLNDTPPVHYAGFITPDDHRASFIHLNEKIQEHKSFKDMMSIACETRNKRERMQPDPNGAKQLPKAVPHPDPNQTYTAYIHDGVHKQVNDLQYRSLVSKAADYDLFIDGRTRRVSKKDSAGQQIEGELTPAELEIATEYVRRKDEVIIPYDTQSGGKCNSELAAKKLLELTRRKVDVKTGENRYGSFRAFRTYKGERQYLTKFAFEPGNMKCCVVVLED